MDPGRTRANMTPGWQVDLEGAAMTVTITTSGVRQESDEAAAAMHGDDEVLREAALATLKRKRKFVQDAVGYVTVNGVLWMIWALTDRSLDGSMPWPAWVSAIWGFLLVIDAWRAYGTWPGSLHRPITEEEIQREMGRSRTG
jgi:hypothetical protein